MRSCTRKTAFTGICFSSRCFVKWSFLLLSFGVISSFFLLYLLPSFYSTCVQEPRVCECLHPQNTHIKIRHLWNVQCAPLPKGYCQQMTCNQLDAQPKLWLWRELARMRPRASSQLCENGTWYLSHGTIIQSETMEKKFEGLISLSMLYFSTVVY